MHFLSIATTVLDEKKEKDSNLRAGAKAFYSPYTLAKLEFMKSSFFDFKSQEINL